MFQESKRIAGLVLLGAFVVLALSGCGGGGGGSTPSTTVDNTPKGTVSGIVTSDGIHPIGGVIVSDSTGAYITTTDSTGAYTLTLPVGAETILFMAKGYTNALGSVTVSSSAAATYNKTMAASGGTTTGTGTPTTTIGGEPSTSSITSFAAFTPSLLANREVVVGSDLIYFDADGTAIINTSDNVQTVTTLATWSVASDGTLTTTTTTGATKGAVDSYKVASQYTSNGVAITNMANVSIVNSPSPPAPWILFDTDYAGFFAIQSQYVAGKTITINVYGNNPQSVFTFATTGNTGVITQLSTTTPFTFAFDASTLDLDITTAAGTTIISPSGTLQPVTGTSYSAFPVTLTYPNGSKGYGTAIIQ